MSLPWSRWAEKQEMSCGGLLVTSLLEATVPQSSQSRSNLLHVFSDILWGPWHMAEAWGDGIGEGLPAPGLAALGCCHVCEEQEELCFGSQPCSVYQQTLSPVFFCANIVCGVGVTEGWKQPFGREVGQRHLLLQGDASLV